MLVLSVAPSLLYFDFTLFPLWTTFDYVVRCAWTLRSGGVSVNLMSCGLLCSRSVVLPFTSPTAPRKAAVTVVWETTSRWVVEPWSHILFLWFSHRTNSTTRPLRTRGPKQMATLTPTLVSLQNLQSLWLFGSVVHLSFKE